jgi:REP element-mobilizing transposase RayT
MTQPIVIAYHLIWTGYGWWLPNDPRGSGSTAIACDVLAQLGEVHHGRKPVQPPRETIAAFQAQAEKLLKFDRLSFDAAQRRTVGQVIGQVIAARRYTCYAAAIMPDHVHLLIRKHRDQAEETIGHFQQRNIELAAMLGVPHDHPIWTRGGWKVFLDHPDDVRRTIRYIVNNPRHAGLPDQYWPFVTPYDGWPLHPGHSPNSPYVKRLKAAGRYPC